MSFGIDVKKYAQKTGLTLQKSVVAICADASKSIIEMTPVDTGRAQGNWFATINSVDKSTSETRSGTEAASVALANANKAYGQVFNLTNNLDYISTLEFGLFPWANSAKVVNHFSTQAPAGMVRITAEKISLAMKRI